MVDLLPPRTHACPSLSRRAEQALIQAECPILAPTGCTPAFCAAGRMHRPLEPRVGENRPVAELQAEATAFLREMAASSSGSGSEGLSSVEARIAAVHAEIEQRAVRSAMVWVDGEAGDVEPQRAQVLGTAGAGWVQTRQELEWGIRVAWRNSRKCIMRAHFQELRLVDLRHVTTSRGMIDAIIQHLPEAYNNGRIRPSVFVFPPRSVDGMGPMFWSHQLLNFAGYEMPGGSILGDPAQVKITKEIVNLGWVPPEPKSKWDILPIVAMAEGDAPAMGVLPAELTALISISHPNYATEFQRLGLKWCKFPALARLGFDIGGVQYTASPFIGWYMDAEIGVRNLADSFRYNVLPQVAESIGWKNNGIDFEDLPAHDKLVWVSRAQAELNYAVHCSFLKAKVTCTSSLAASESWTAFDDQYKKDHGHRLNSDPYWISPPQGSIVPVWHRGAAPNYQPKPLITKHRYDPINVWKRRTGVPAKLSEKIGPDISMTMEIFLEKADLVRLFYCGTGGTALKMAEKVRSNMQKRKPKTVLEEFGVLNSADPSRLGLSDTVLIVISTTGQGEIPTNGQQFLQKMQILKQEPIPLRYAIFGIGDSGYHRTFNGAGRSINQFFFDINASPLCCGGLFESDVAAEDPPLSALQSWWKLVDSGLRAGQQGTDSVLSNPADHYLQQYSWLNSYKEATIAFDKNDHQVGRMMKLSLKVKENTYQEMGHIRLMPRNPAALVQRIASLLKINAEALKIPFPKSEQGETPVITAAKFLTDFVDLYEPFSSLAWVGSLYPHFDMDLVNSSVLQIIEDMFQIAGQAPPQPHALPQIFFSMPLLRSRTYSIASSPAHRREGGYSAIDILLRIIPHGRFSDRYLSSLPHGGSVRYKLTPNNACLPLLNCADRPLIAVACGTGIGPLRSLLQLRLQQTRSESVGPKARLLQSLRRLRKRTAAAAPPFVRPKMSLFLGFQGRDNSAFINVVHDAARRGLLDALSLVPSNAAKVRVQDGFGGRAAMLQRKLLLEDSFLYICGSGLVVADIKLRLAEILGKDFEQRLGERLILEVF